MKMQQKSEDQTILINHSILSSNFASKDKGLLSADKQIRELKLFQTQNDVEPMLGENI